MDDRPLLGTIDARERLCKECLVRREGDLWCKIKLSTKAPVYGGKKTHLRWMNFRHKQMKTLDLTCQSTQRRYTF